MNETKFYYNPFEIAVIGVVSSGKSTLINALLGQKILPARNEATTAKIAQIRHNPDSAGFTVRGLKKDESEQYVPADEPKPATLEAIELLNSSDDIAKIELEGKIPGINSRGIQLILSDTPGPNNYRTVDHAVHIDQLIKADYKPMIMYILNVTQLEINDDKVLLEKIIKGFGRQGTDRFLFVLNKADELDPDRGEVEKKLADAKKYLGQFGIEDPRIFPASAYLAKIIRMTQSGNANNISRKKQIALNAQLSFFIEEEKLHFSEYASLSPSCKLKQKAELNKAVADKNENAQAFIYSGIRAIELAIDEYLEKYALTVTSAEENTGISLIYNSAPKILNTNQSSEEHIKPFHGGTPMNEIKFYYNPFEARVALQYKGKDELLPCMGNGQPSRLQDWLYQFLPELKQKQNWGDGSECTISFTGTPGDFEDIEDAYRVFKKDNPGIAITLVHLNRESKSLKTRMSDLKALFERMQKESPYDELKAKNLKPDFDRALNADFEISVIATMSSGKSTLINALLGREILPARNEATTAKIAQIRHNPDASGFTVRGLKMDENEAYVPVDEPKPATLEAIEFLNDSEKSPDIAKIELEGKIPGIDSREMQLILSDTPGPNNSRTADHRVHIDQLIKADYKPMIMYILNATQLEINDDKALLEDISKAMKGSGKQGTDRFLFVLNKADELDPDKGEFVEKKLADAKKYLGQFGIEKPRIFPASAYLAKVIRMTQLGNAVSRKEQTFLNGQRSFFIEDESLHFSEYASLSPSCKLKQKEELAKAVEGKNENTQAFIYSGIRAIELAMDEYLEKYAFPAKISQAVDTFNNAIKRLELKNKTEKALVEDNKAREDVLKTLGELQERIAKGDRAKELMSKFDEDIKTIKSRLASSFTQKRKDANLWFIQERLKYKDDVSEEKAKSIVDDTQNQMELAYKILTADLEKVFEKELKQQADRYIAEYQAYIAGLMQGDSFTVNAALNLVQMSVPENTDALLNRFTGEKTEYETRTVTRTRENTDKKWYKPWTWFQPKYEEYDAEETYSYSVKVIKMGPLFENSIQPQSYQFEDTIKKAESVAEQNADDLKNFFQREIGKLDDALKETINRQQEGLKSQEALEKNIEANKAKAEWLEGFIQDLNAVLDI